ncbi:helix-turn-helix transcriptional regulator [Haloarchaeobius sp. HRN-SO-5]|uniref:helix-turn-helix transcriptional regulator n=1 Tax=Haloarchaeobius sp. HRN-SO-5 TaxID=3446118 RepID=UPI003EB88C3D
MTNSVLDEILETTLELVGRQRTSDVPPERMSTAELNDVVQHRGLLEVLIDGPLYRDEIQERLDVSRATSHRFTRWLQDNDLAERVDGRYRLTGKGTTYADEVLRFERNLRTATALAPLLDVICEYHQEFVIPPFADATVTTATPDDPHRPVARFVALLRDSSTFRGFNTTHMVPPALADVYDHLFDGIETELIYLPDVVDNLVETYPDRLRVGIDAGHLRLRTREALPYGLAIFDDRVGIAGFDEETGSMHVFVDSDSAIACAWADRVFETYRNNSDPIELHAYLDD